MSEQTDKALTLILDHHIKTRKLIGELMALLEDARRQTEFDTILFAMRHIENCEEEEKRAAGAFARTFASGKLARRYHDVVVRGRDE